MAVRELRQDCLHGSLPEYSRAGLDPETVAILLYCGHLTVIQINNLTVTPTQRLLALLEYVRVDCRSMFFLSCQDLKC